MRRMRRSIATLVLAAAAAVVLWLEQEAGFEPTTSTTAESVGDAGSSGAARESAREGGTRLSNATLPHWSDDRPNVNLWHVFLGEINRHGEPTGFHSRPDGLDPPNARVERLRDGPNAVGVYTATVEVRDGARWKRKFSTFFPDSMTADEVVDTILNAYHASPNPTAQPWEGPSGHGFRIQGYTSSRGGIATAFPIYTPSR